MRTNEAREKAAEDNSLSRFMGSKRAMGDDIEQLADVVYTDKRQQPLTLDQKKNIAAYLNNEDRCARKIRDICIVLGCYCSAGRGHPCNCTCDQKGENTKLAK